MCTCCDAVPKCLEQEQYVMPAGLLPLRAQLGVTALAGFLDCLWGLCQKVHWKVLILLVPGLAATNMGSPTVFINVEVNCRVVSCKTRV